MLQIDFFFKCKNIFFNNFFEIISYDKLCLPSYGIIYYDLYYIYIIVIKNKNYTEKIQYYILISNDKMNNRIYK